jgi:hypothetical protein
MRIPKLDKAGTPAAVNVSNASGARRRVSSKALL